MLKNSVSEIATYRDKAIDASVVGNSALAVCWRLAADEAKNFIRQKTPLEILIPENSPFASNLADLIKANQEAKHYLSSSSSSPQEWMFATDETQEATSHYRTWMARSQAQTSPAFQREIIQTREASHRYAQSHPEVASLAQEAAGYFTIAQHIQAAPNASNAISKEVLVHRWKTVAITATHSANLKLQVAAIGRDHPQSIYHGKKAEALAERALFFRKQAAEATQEGKEQSALQWSLAAYSADHASDIHCKISQSLLSGETSIDSYGQEISLLAEQAAKQRAQGLEQAAFWAENAFDYGMRVMEMTSFENQFLISSWKDAAHEASRASILWAQTIHNCSSWYGLKIITACWKEAAYRSENRVKKKLLNIAAYLSRHLSQHSFKDAAAEIARYREEVLRATLAENHRLALSWRLAADAARDFLQQMDSCEKFPSAHDWAALIQQATQTPGHPFLSFLYGIQKEKKFPTWMFATDETQEAASNYRYWIARSQSLKTTTPLEIATLCWNHLETVSQRAPFRMKALRNNVSVQTPSPNMDDMASYRTEKNGQIIQIASPQEGGSERVASERALFWLENALDYLVKAEESTSENKEAWKEVAQEAKQTAALWAQAADCKPRWYCLGMTPLFKKRAARRAEKKILKKILGILLKKISFCLPEQSLPDAACRKAWKEGKVVPRIEYTTFYNWIYQSWNLLQEAGVTCELSTQPLTQGVVITLGAYLTNTLGLENTVPADVFLIDVMADGIPHPAAHLHVVQNKIHAHYLPDSLFMPFWSQARLIPRNPERGIHFENVCFFGDENNLAPELRSEAWRQRLLQELGISFHLRGNTGWHDYSEIDCILAIRDFSHRRFFYKPATKLYNAWQAGVPFIGGRDSAYAIDGDPGKNYLVATSPEEVFQHLKRLKEDVCFRNMLVQSGLQSADSFTRAATLERWKKLIQETIPDLVLHWQETSTRKRRWRALRQRFSCVVERTLR